MLHITSKLGLSAESTTTLQGVDTVPPPDLSHTTAARIRFTYT